MVGRGSSPSALRVPQKEDRAVGYPLIKAGVLCAMGIVCAGCVAQAETMDEMRTRAGEDCCVPVRPGVPGQREFWNRYSENFMYAPAFDIPAHKWPGAKSYRYTVHSGADNKDYVFSSDVPYAPLSPIWKDLPTGPADLTVEAIKADGSTAATVGKRAFNKIAGFSVPHIEPMKPFKESARWALEFQFSQKHYQAWKKGARVKYHYNIYPAKMLAAVINGMVCFSKLSPKDSGDAILMAENAAKFLIDASYPAGSRFEYLPPTYDSTQLPGPTDWWKDRAEGRIMPIYSAEAGLAYLKLYDATGNKAYLQAAQRIADTYRKLQLPDGTWHLKLFVDTGKPDGDFVTIPIVQVDFLDKLVTRYGMKQYRDMRDKAVKWIFDNPMTTYNWQGQFEDVPPAIAYLNLSHIAAADTAIYLFDHAKENPSYVAQAEEIMRFVEDQFVVWEPRDAKDKRFTPCGLEQYWCYQPIGGSAIRIVRAWLKAYQATGDQLYLEKAKALAASQTMVQDQETGQYRTFWYKDNTDRTNNWDNCATNVALGMVELADLLEKAAKP